MIRNDIKTDGSIDFNKIEPTGNFTVDMIMSCIYFYRTKNKALDTIWLNTYHYSQLEKWTRDRIKTKEKDDDYLNFEFDGVRIKKNPVRSNKELDVTFYQAPTLSDVDDLPTKRK